MSVMKTIVTLSTLFVLTILASGLAFAAPPYWPNVQEVPLGSVTIIDNNLSSIAVSSSGTRGIAYATSSVSGTTFYTTLYYATLDDNGEWSETVVHSRSISPIPTIHRQAVKLAYDGDDPVIAWLTFNYPIFTVSKHTVSGGAEILQSYSWANASAITVSLDLEPISGMVAWSRYSPNMFGNTVSLYRDGTVVTMESHLYHIFDEVHLAAKSGGGSYLAYCARDPFLGTNATKVYSCSNGTQTLVGNLPLVGIRTAMSTRVYGSILDIAFENAANNTIQIKTYFGGAWYDNGPILTGVRNLGSLVGIPNSSSFKLSALKTDLQYGQEVQIYDFSTSTWQSVLGSATMTSPMTCRPLYAISDNPSNLYPMIRATRYDGTEQLVTAEP